jgi:SEC-C motif-containing protein
VVRGELDHAEVQREVSRFVRDRSRRWLYVDGMPG